MWIRLLDRLRRDAEPMAAQSSPLLPLNDSQPDTTFFANTTTSIWWAQPKRRSEWVAPTLKALD